MRSETCNEAMRGWSVRRNMMRGSGWFCSAGVDWAAVEEFVDLRDRLSHFAVFPKTKAERK